MVSDGVDEYIDLGRVTDTEGAANYSVSFWMWMSSDSPTNYIMGRFNGANNSFYITKANLTNGNGIGVTIGDGSSYGVVRMDNAITFSQWIHVVVVYDGSLSGGTNRVKIYVDDTLEARTESLTIPTTINSDTTSMALFALGGSTSNNVQCRLDEVRFYDYALTSGNVSSIYNSGTPIEDDLSTLATHKYRMGDDDTWGGTNWTLNDTGTTGGNNGTSANMEEADRLTSVV